jgi:hypothetical protein
MAVRFYAAEGFSALWTYSINSGRRATGRGMFGTITGVISFSFREFTVYLLGLFEVSPDIRQRLGCPLIHFCRQ